MFNRVSPFLSTLLQSVFRFRYVRMSYPEIITPPEHVKGMTTLDKAQFTKSVVVPCLTVPATENLNKLIPILKPKMLKLRHFRPVREPDSDSGQKVVFLNPDEIREWADLPTEKLRNFKLEESCLGTQSVEITYENYQLRALLKSILPDGQEGVSSYSQIGHIVHVNLREEVLPYKAIVGQVLLDNVPNCRTVVNKTSNIDTVYRNFELELLAGEQDYTATVKENGLSFEFDFSKVYWNSRLCTEHDRIVKLVKSTDIVYDVFAGVGPFSIPIAKKHKCRVLANDLNPESVKYLRHNKKLNKIGDHLEVFNRDGKDFIRDEVRLGLSREMESSSGSSDAIKTIHIIMNLPAIAKEFLQHFVGLISDKSTIEKWNSKLVAILVHVYCFVRDDDMDAAARSSVEEQLGRKLPSELIQNITFVRNVAPNKEMMRVSFYLSKEVLFREPAISHEKRKLEGEEEVAEERQAKKQSCS